MYQVPNTPKLRESQIFALDAVQKAFREGYQTVIIQAPTGTGKTLLGRYIAESFEDTLVGVPTRALQDQYSSERLQPGGVAILKGKANYSCAIYPGRTAENAPCQGSGGSMLVSSCKSKGCCPYIEAKEEAKESPIAVLSFGGLLSWSRFSPETFGSRQLRVIDEAHKIEDIIRDNFSEDVSEAELRKQFGKNAKHLPPMPETGGKEELLDYLRKCASIARSRLQELLEIYDADSFAELFERSDMEDDIKRNFMPVYKFTASIDEMFERINSDQGAYTVTLERKADKKGTVHPHIILKPIHLEELVRTHVLGPKNVFMSATLVGVHEWAKCLGIKNYKFIDLPSSFPAQNRRAFFTPIGALSKSNLKLLLGTGVKKVQQIAGRPELSDKKGLIHTPSYAFTKDLQAYLLSDPRFIFAPNKEESSLALKEHITRKDPTILVGPAYKEGIDLKDELCRFIVIWKCSYGNPTDPLVRLKVAEDKTWDVRRFLGDFVQQMGRGVRSKDDWAVTYILDENLRKEVRKHSNLLPNYILEGLQNL